MWPQPHGCTGQRGGERRENRERRADKLIEKKEGATDDGWMDGWRYWAVQRSCCHTSFCLFNLHSLIKVQSKIQIYINKSTFDPCFVCILFKLFPCLTWNCKVLTLLCEESYFYSTLCSSLESWLSLFTERHYHRELDCSLKFSANTSPLRNNVLGLPGNSQLLYRYMVVGKETFREIL